MQFNVHQNTGFFCNENISTYSLCKSVRYLYRYWYVESSELENSVQDLQKVLSNSFRIFKSLL